MDSDRLGFDRDPRLGGTLAALAEPAAPQPVGLDAIYRPTPEGDIKCGPWADPNAFVVEIIDIGRHTIRMRFEGDQVFVESPENGISFQGQVQNP